MPGLIRGTQPDARRDNVDGPVAQEKPLVLRIRQDNEPAALKKIRNTKAGLYSEVTL